MADPNYRVNFLEMTSSVYPDFIPQARWGSLILGTIEGIGAIAGLVLPLVDDAFTHVRNPA